MTIINRIMRSTRNNRSIGYVVNTNQEKMLLKLTFRLFISLEFLKFPA